MGYNLTKRNPLYELIADYTVSGSAITSYTFDLSATPLTKDEDYVLVSEFYNSTGTGSAMYLYANNNTTASNYYNQYIVADSTRISANRDVKPEFTYVANGARTLSITKIKLTNSGYYTIQSNSSRSEGGSSTNIENQYATSTFTSTSITRLDVTAYVSGTIGIGTRFQLYRIRPASKIADVTIGSATTSYTFTDLNIGKGSEYMLVVDLVSTTPSNDVLLYMGNTTSSNYYAQRIYAGGTTVSSARTNTAKCCELGNNTEKTLLYSNIKLTNNGYCVAQNNSSYVYGGSNIHLFSIYETSTFTTSSITSIQISSSNTDGLGIGTRFQLYKLK